MIKLSELERLNAWMDENDYSKERLAKEIGMTYMGIYSMMVLREHVNTPFKWRFAQRFGYETAMQLFDTDVSEPTNA